MENQLKRLIFSTFFLFSPFLTIAHSYWMEVTGSGKPGKEAIIRIYFGEYDNNLREKGAKLGNMKDFRAYFIDPTGQQRDITLSQTETCWEGKFIPTQEGRYQVVAISNTREVQDLTKYGHGVIRPIEYLRYDYTIGKDQVISAPTLDLDVIANQKGNQLALTAFKDKKPAPKMKLTVVNPSGWKKVLTTIQDGTVQFSPSETGLYLLEIELTDNNPGQYKGKSYSAVRTKFTSSLLVGR